MTGKSASLSRLYCAKTLMSGMSTLLSHLHCAEMSNVRKVYIAIKSVFYEDVKYQEH